MRERAIPVGGASLNFTVVGGGGGYQVTQKRTQFGLTQHKRR